MLSMTSLSSAASIEPDPSLSKLVKLCQRSDQRGVARVVFDMGGWKAMMMRPMSRR